MRVLPSALKLKATACLQDLTCCGRKHREFPGCIAAPPCDLGDSLVQTTPLKPLAAANETRTFPGQARKPVVFVVALQTSKLISFGPALETEQHMTQMLRNFAFGASEGCSSLRVCTAVSKLSWNLSGYARILFGF
jgi:hypothetical protein